jgi:hypothetical protein
VKTSVSELQHKIKSSPVSPKIKVIIYLIAMGYCLGGQCSSPDRGKISSSPTASKLALGSIKLLYNGYLTLFPLPRGVEWPGCETNCLPPSSAEVKMVYLYVHSPYTSSRYGSQLSKGQPYV